MRPAPKNRETRVSLRATAPHLTKNDADGRRSFAAVERSMSDRLLRTVIDQPDDAEFVTPLS